MDREALDELDALVRDTAFSGVVRVDADGATTWRRADGRAHRGLGVANTVDTRFAIASGTKSMTALVVMRLVVDGLLELSTTARSLLGDDLPLVDDRVTVEHLLAHRSGIGDYLDEDAVADITDHVLDVPVHLLVSTEDYLRVLDGRPQAFAPGERFAYCNGGYVLLALLAERATGRGFHDLVDEIVCRPAGMRDTGFQRGDETHPRTAVGYLHADGLRTNVLHLPVRGSGDGGLVTTVDDVHRCWSALDAGEIVPHDVVALMTTPRSVTASGASRYGLGFWVGEGGAVEMEGMDAGVSFRSVHDRERGVTYTVVSNTTQGAWPIARWLRDRLGA